MNTFVTKKESEDGRCALTITTTGPTDVTTWGVVWEVGSELKDLCVRQGAQGREINLGMSNIEAKGPGFALMRLIIGYDRHIIIQLTSPRADISSS